MISHLLYRGTVRHRRFLPRINEFTYKQFMFCFDITKVQETFKSIKQVSIEKFNWFSFKRCNYLKEHTLPMDQSVRQIIQEKTGIAPTGKIFLLTHLSCLGYCFNPISIYFVFKPDSNELETLLLEVTNTPWGEQHFYVLNEATRPHPDIYQYAFNKALHVSPFMAMNYKYEFNLKLSDEQIMVHMLSYMNDELHFDATLLLNAVPNNRFQPLKTFLRFPLLTYKVTAAIYWQALILWIKGVPVHAHPVKKKEAA